MKINFAKKFYWRKKSERMHTVLGRLTVIAAIGMTVNWLLSPKLSPEERQALAKKFVFSDWLGEKLYLLKTSYDVVLDVFRSDHTTPADEQKDNTK